MNRYLVTSDRKPIPGCRASYRRGMVLPSGSPRAGNNKFTDAAVDKGVCAPRWTAQPSSALFSILNLHVLVSRVMKYYCALQLKGYKMSQTYDTHILQQCFPTCVQQHTARAVEVWRGQMSEINTFQWEVSMTFSTLIENVSFPKFSHGTLLPLHHNMITQS